MTDRIIHFHWGVLPIHRPYHASRARIKAAIGGVGSGKSAALAMEAHRFALAQPGSDMLLTRRTVPDLKRSTEKELMEVMPTELETLIRSKDGIKRSGGHIESITYPNGSLLTLAGMEDWKKHKSMNLAWIGIDEASEQTLDNFEGILTRLRQTRPLKGSAPLAHGQTMVNQCAVASNPNGQDWLYSTFVDPQSRRKDSSIHLSTPMDNPYLPPEYLEMLLQMPVPFIRRFIECRFDAAAGRVYPDWAWETHVLPRKEPGFYGKTAWQLMDPGTAVPTASLWVELDEARGRLVAVAEYQQESRSAAEHTGTWRATEAAMKSAGGVLVKRRIADPNITKRDQGSNTALSDIYAKLGFSFEQGPVTDDIRIPSLQNAIASGAFVCTEACPELHNQILNARWEDQIAKLRDLGEFKEKMRKGNDHLHDCAQYGATQHLSPAKVTLPAKPTPEQLASGPDEIEAAWHRDRAAKLAKQARGGKKPPQYQDGVVV